MVLRLFVPPGDGQHTLVPGRSDAIGANATLQYSVVASTTLAAAYTSFASRYYQRVAPSQSISKTALFIRSSARLGIWAGVAGAAATWYYNTAFLNAVLPYGIAEVKSFELYKWTRRYTVDDGALAGAGLGLAASIPTLFMRRPAIPPWTRCLGMANIGACAGILGAHRYFHYTGERYEAYRCLDRRLKRRSLEFWHMYWDKEFMARLDPLMQHYVRHNAVWYTQLLPEEAFEQPEEYVRRTVEGEKRTSTTEAPLEERYEEPAYYLPGDYAKELDHIDVEKTLARIAGLEAERKELLEEAEYLFFVNAQQKYEYCHLKDMDDEERQRRLREMHLATTAYERLRWAANTIDVKLVHWRMSLQHKAVSTSSAATDDQVADWLPKSELIGFHTHRPTVSIQEMEHMHATIAAEVKKFEDCAAYAGYPQAKREKWKRDAEDGRVLLRAAEHVIFRLEKARKASATAAEATSEQKQEEGASASVKRAGAQTHHRVHRTTNAMGPQADEEKQNKTQVNGEKPVKPHADGLEPEKP